MWILPLNRKETQLSLRFCLLRISPSAGQMCGLTVSSSSGGGAETLGSLLWLPPEKRGGPSRVAPVTSARSGSPPGCSDPTSPSGQGSDSLDGEAWPVRLPNIVGNRFETVITSPQKVLILEGSYPRSCIDPGIRSLSRCWFPVWLQEPFSDGRDSICYTAASMWCHLQGHHWVMFSREESDAISNTRISDAGRGLESVFGKLRLGSALCELEEKTL